MALKYGDWRLKFMHRVQRLDGLTKILEEIFTKPSTEVISEKGADKKASEKKFAKAFIERRQPGRSLIFVVLLRGAEEMG